LRAPYLAAGEAAGHGGSGEAEERPDGRADDDLEGNGGARPAGRRSGAAGAAGNPSRALGLLVELAWEMRKKRKKSVSIV
jgi:hypothetical protein